MENLKRSTPGSLVTFLLPGAILGMFLFLNGCSSTPVDWDMPIVLNENQVDDAATLSVEDPFLAGQEDMSVLERLYNTSEELKVQSEKNAQLVLEITAMQETRDNLKTALDEAKNRAFELNEEVAALKAEKAKRESDLEGTLREKRDLLEKLVDLRIEKTNIEKELLKIKIAALSGE